MRAGVSHERDSHVTHVVHKGVKSDEYLLVRAVGRRGFEPRT